ncbi:MAG: fibrobacter succinogenes major paralogous domain-containing protein [Flavobacteriales bacterium]
MSTSLSLEVLQTGYYEVSLENGALQVSTNDPEFPIVAQIVTSIGFTVSGVPSITVPNNLDYRMCEGSDWTAPISGASSLSYISPYTGDLIELSSTTGTIDWVMPWSEAEAAIQAGEETVFELLATSDFGGAVCTGTWTLTLDVVGNPMINPISTNVPAEVCVGQSVTISSGLVQGSHNGQPIWYVWSNAGDDPIFNVTPLQSGALAEISVNTDIPVPASGDVTFTVTDGIGCQADTTLSVVIHELPTFGALTATPDAVCTGEEIQLSFDGIDVDDNLDETNATYSWSASIDGNSVPVSGDAFSLAVTPLVNGVVAEEFTEPTPVVFELTAGSDGCVATQTWDDVVIVYPGVDAVGICGGECLEDDDNNGVCDTAEVLGCTYELADNYDPMATRDDGLCEFPCSGDINQNIFDWDANGNIGIADFLQMLSVFGDVDVDGDGVWDSQDDCVDLEACNYASELNEPCTYLPPGDCDCNGNVLDECGVCGGTGLAPGTCDCNGTLIDVIGECGGDCWVDEDADGICDDVDECVGEYDACGVCNGPGAIYECGCANIPEGECDCDGNVLDAIGVCGGACSADEDADGVCDDVDDCVGEFDVCGVCNGPGEVYECGCGDVPEGECDCEGNMLDALGECGGECLADEDGDGVCDDVDDCVGEFDECGVCNGDGAFYECGCNDIPEGECDCDGNVFDECGVCGGDNSSCTDECGVLNGPGAIYECGCADIPEGDCDCDGNVFDECGVCNGPGPTDIVIEDIVTYYDSVYLPFDNAWYVYPVDADTTFGFTCAPSFQSCGDLVNYQGYDYATVLIGDQCWFAENLRSENYENGDAIPSNLSDSEWGNTLSGAVAVYGAGSSECYNDSPDGDACDESWSLNEYGRLYNWYAVDDARGLCPSGWHVPTDGEWMTLEMALGMSESDANDTGFRGTDQGTQMKTDYGWSGGGNGTNSSGFSGLPGGYRLNDGYFNYAGYYGDWWSSSPYGYLAWSRFLINDVEGVGRFHANPNDGFSVRCVQDSEE